MSDKLSKFLQMEIDQINTHLPAKPIPLSILDRMEHPGYRLRDGSFSDFSTEEMEKIKKIIPETIWSQVLLPIIIIRRRDLGQGSFTVGGSDPNRYIIEHLFEDDIASYDMWRLDKSDVKIFYRPHIRTIRKQFPTTTVIGFT